MVLKRILFVFVKRVISQTKTKIDDIFLRAADLPVTLLIFASGGLLIERIVPSLFNIKVADHFLVTVKAVTIIAAVLFIDRFLVGLLQSYRDQIELLQSAGGFIKIFVRVSVFGLGLLVLLDSFGVSITPILASLGIGSLAVALAIQPTLENLFSGIQIIADKPFQEGHFVKLESGEEGYVDKIGWRSTWIRLPQHNVVVVPNKLLVNAKLLNYYYPTRELVINVALGVHYNSDLEKVERVLTQVATETLRSIEGGIKDFEPTVRFHTFNNSSIDCTIALRVREFADGGIVKHEFIKRVHKRFAQEGIVIPYPIQAVNYTQEVIPGDLLQNENIRDILK